jgi:hypothetical protein
MRSDFIPNWCRWPVLRLTLSNFSDLTITRREVKEMQRSTFLCWLVKMSALCQVWGQKGQKGHRDRYGVFWGRGFTMVHQRCGLQGHKQPSEERCARPYQQKNWTNVCFDPMWIVYMQVYMVWRHRSPGLVGAINRNEPKGNVQAMISTLPGYELLHIINH